MYLGVLLVVVAGLTAVAGRDVNLVIHTNSLPVRQPMRSTAWNFRRLRAVPPSLATCICTSTTKALLNQCCNFYVKCCAEANLLATCPTNVGTNDCFPFGTYCRTSSDCGNANMKCCPATDAVPAGGTRPTYKCCTIIV